MSIDFSKFLPSQNAEDSSGNAKKNSIDLNKFLPIKSQIQTQPKTNVPKTYQQGVMENGQFVTKTVTVGGGEIKAPTGNEKQDFKTDLDLAIKTPTTTYADKAGAVIDVILNEGQLPKGFDWLRKVVKSGYESAKGSITSAAEGLGQIIDASAGTKLSDYDTQPGWSKYNSDGTENPNYLKEVQAQKDYLKSKELSNLQKFVLLGEGSLKIGSLAFAKVMAELSAAKELPGVLSLPAKGIDWGFQQLGKAGVWTSDKGVDFLPVSKEVKDTIRPLAEELGAFVAQLVGIKMVHSVIETGGSKIVEKLPISKEAKQGIETTAKVGAGIAMQPFSTAFNMANGMIMTKIAEREAKKIEITKEEVKKIVDEVKKQLPERIDKEISAGNIDLDKFTAKKVSDLIETTPEQDRAGAEARAIMDDLKFGRINDQQATEQLREQASKFYANEAETMQKIQETVRGYQTFGGFTAGKEAPNAYLRDLATQLKTANGQQIAEKSVEQAISKGDIKPDENGDIILYRVGKIGNKNELYSTTYDKSFAEQFSEANKQPIQEIKVKPEDIKYVIGGVEKEVLLSTKQPKTQTEIVKQAVQVETKTIQQIAEQTKILEPNVRRILGVGAKEGTFERVDKGVYILKNNGKEVAYVETGDAVDVLPRLAKEGVKADMVFLDIPYKTPAVSGGNRGAKFEFITVEQFKNVVEAVKKIARGDNSPIFYMFSQAPSGIKEMQKYTDVMTSAGFKPVARGEYTKLQKDGVTRTRNMRGTPDYPEGIILFTKSGSADFKNPDLNFKLIRPKGYQTEKPAEMARKMVEMSTKEGDVVLDPFAGSGVVPAEAVKAGRQAIAIEKSEKAVEEFIKPRVEEASKKYPTIHEGGKIKMVEGTPVEIVKGVETFLHEGDGGWIVSEASTGRYIADSRSKEGVIAKAKFVIDDIGVDKFKKSIEKYKLPLKKQPRFAKIKKQPTQKITEPTQTKTLYHGTPQEIKGKELTYGMKKGKDSGGIFLTDNKDVANVFAFNGKVYEIGAEIKKQVVDLTEKIGIDLFKNEIGKEYTTFDGEKIKFSKEDFDLMFPQGKADFASVSQYPELVQKVVDQSKMRGIAFNEYAGGKIGKTYQILNGNIPIKSEPVAKPTIEAQKGVATEPEGKEVGRVSGVAKSIEAKAIEQGLSKGFSDLAEYTPIVIKEQAKMISDIMSKDIERAKRIALGQEALPEGLKGAAVVKALEDYAMETRNGQLAQQLANSPLVTEISKSGQTMRLAAEREPDSATAKIREIAKERETVAEKKLRGRNKTQVESEIKKGLTEKIKSQKPTKASWEKFLEEIKC